MKKRVLAALLVTMMTVGTVAGCGSNAKSDDSDKKASSESKSDDKKDSGKKVTVVTSGTGEPYSLISDDGKWTGIDAEMWDEIEKRTGWEVEVKQASFDAMWGELDTGRADVVANCLAVKEERTEQYKKENKVKTDENQNEKDEIIQKINDVLSVLEYERLEEVLKYVKRKKNQKK